MSDSGLETLPSLYGTKERRPRTKVKDAGSGFVAGGKGFALGFYDGLSGLVLDPVRGAKAEVNTVCMSFAIPGPQAD